MNIRLRKLPGKSFFLAVLLITCAYALSLYHFPNVQNNVSFVWYGTAETKPSTGMDVERIPMIESNHDDGSSSSNKKLEPTIPPADHVVDLSSPSSSVTFNKSISTEKKLSTSSESFIQSKPPEEPTRTCGSTPLSEKPKMVKASVEYNHHHLSSSETSKASYASFNYTEQYQRAGYFNFNQYYHGIHILRHPNTTSSLSNATESTTPVMSVFVPCRFNPSVNVLLHHFVHAMEQIYLCFDYWINAAMAATENEATSSSLPPPNSTIFPRMLFTPLLLYDNHTQEKFWKIGKSHTPFLRGVLEVLTSQLGLEQMSVQEFLLLTQQQEPQWQHQLNTTSTTTTTTTITDTTAIVSKSDIPYFTDPNKGFLLQHAEEWNQMVQRHLSQTGTEVPTNDAPDDSCTRPPRIRILSRKKNRGISNAQELADRLSALQYRNNTLSYVKVHYFEGETFQDQVRFFQDTDILITGHGAQLTGLPFMMGGSSSSSGGVGGNGSGRLVSLPSSCSQLLELYPNNYAIPYYFGSLAVQSGVSHSYMYLAFSNRTDVVLPWETRSLPEMKDRNHARSVHLCPEVNTMVEAVVDLIQDWHECCLRSSGSNSERKVK